MTPTRIPSRAAPAAVDACMDTVRKRHEDQAGSLHIQLAPTKKVVHLSVDLDHFCTKGPAKEVNQMNRMVHHRAASSKLLVGKPCPVPRWDLAVVIPVDSQDSPELSIFDHAPTC